MVPDDPRLKAAIAHLVAERYPFTKSDVPGIVSVLGLDDPKVEQAHQALFEQPIEAIYSTEPPPDTRAFWLRLPNLSRQLMEDLVKELKLITLPWTETLYRQGDPSDAFYAMVSGRVREVATNEEGQEVIVGEWGRGRVIGMEAAFFQESRRPTTIVAVRDSELARMDRQGMERLFLRYPELGLSLTREIVSQMRESLARQRASSKIVTIAIVPAHPDVPLSAFVKRLVGALQRHGSSLHLSSRGIDAQLGEEASQEETLSDRMVYWFSAIELAHRFILMETDKDLTPWTQRCIHMADRVLVVAQSERDARLREIETHMYQAGVDQFTIGVELVLLQPSRSKQPEGTSRWLQPRNVIRHHHAHMGTPADFDRLARFLAGRATGLVLSGGGARGMAHIGVYRALQEAGIPIDAVGAASFGSIMAGAIGLEWDWERLHQEVYEFTRMTRRYFRPALPLVSLMEGHRLSRLFQSYYGLVHIEDLWRHLFCVSSNLTRSRLEIMERGPIWRAVRASMSIPGVFPPMLTNGELLTDGGATNNMPSDIMKEWLEGGLVLASNTSPEEVHTYHYDDEHASSWTFLLSRVNPSKKADRAPSIIDVVNQTTLLASKWRIPRQMKNTDLLLEIPVGQYGLFDYAAFDDLVELGYRTTLQALEGWDQEGFA